jgi:hypothetical protein
MHANILARFRLIGTTSLMLVLIQTTVSSALVNAQDSSFSADAASKYQREPENVLAQATSSPAATPAQNKPEAGSKEGTPATVVDGQQLQSVLGISAISVAGEDMGRVVDIIVDRNGQVRAAIIDFGGFLGVGSRKIAVDWGALHFLPKSKADSVEVDLTKDQLRVAPVYKSGEPVVVIGHAAAKP